MYIVNYDNGVHMCSVPTKSVWEAMALMIKFTLRGWNVRILQISNNKIKEVC